jgi:UPF0755 protein
VSLKKSKNQSTSHSVINSLKKILLTGFVVTIVFGLAAIGAVYLGINELRQPVGLHARLLFEVNKGESLKEVAYRLQSNGTIQSSFWFYWFGRYKDVDRKLKAGEYWLSPALSEKDLFAVFSTGKTATYSIRFLEGWNLKQVISELDNHPKLIRNIRSADPSVVAGILGMTQASAEGLIFPDTYAYYKGMSDTEILHSAYKKMLSTVEELWGQRSAEAVVKSPYEALILASIVEKETGSADERGLIAGVFYARLKKRMRLQTDPTVIYGLGDHFDGNLTRAHLHQLTPYNTYQIEGLPPTPIAMPGRAAIAAAVRPEMSGYLYFVAQGDGTHRFSKNLHDHNNAVRQYQKNRRKDYRSAQ